MPPGRGKIALFEPFHKPGGFGMLTVKSSSGRWFVTKNSLLSAATPAAKQKEIPAKPRAVKAL
jgi:hypothetical protein